MAKLPTIMRDTRKRLQEGGDATDESISGQLGISPRETPAQKTELTAGETISPTPITPQTEEDLSAISVFKSNKVTGIFALHNCAAIPLPIVPDPMTTTFFIFIETDTI